MTATQDAHAAQQLEQHLHALIAESKAQLQGHLDDGDIDAMRDELAHLMALEACRRHALADTPEPLDTLAETGYRILNNFLEARQ